MKHNHKRSSLFKIKPLNEGIILNREKLIPEQFKAYEDFKLKEVIKIIWIL